MYVLPEEVLFQAGSTFTVPRTIDVAPLKSEHPPRRSCPHAANMTAVRNQLSVAGIESMVACASAIVAKGPISATYVLAPSMSQGEGNHRWSWRSAEKWLPKDRTSLLRSDAFEPPVPRTTHSREGGYLAEVKIAERQKDVDVEEGPVLGLCCRTNPLLSNTSRQPVLGVVAEDLASGVGVDPLVPDDLGLPYRQPVVGRLEGSRRPFRSWRTTLETACG
jgi:hypothetical protein